MLRGGRKKKEDSRKRPLGGIFIVKKGGGEAKMPLAYRLLKGTGGSIRGNRTGITKLSGTRKKDGGPWPAMGQGGVYCR